MTDKEYFENCFKPIIRFAVTSDVHITGNDYGEDERLPILFDDMYSYAENHDTYNRLDGVFVAGDFVNRGRLPWMEKFARIVSEHQKEETVVRIILGNHEFFEDDVPAVENLKKAFGYDSPDAHIVIGDYHFILLSPSEGGDTFEADKQAWLAEQMKIAAADDPSGRRPIFVFQHHHIAGTVLGSGRGDWGVTDLRAILNQYPQAVDFSGHSHYNVSDPRSIWQGEFTALGTGSLNYCETDIVGVRRAALPSDMEGGFGTDRLRGTAQFYVVEVDANNAIKVQIYNAGSRCFADNPIYIRSVGDPSEFIYTADRAEKIRRSRFC